jgi:hypothetical protein
MEDGNGFVDDFKRYEQYVGQLDQDQGLIGNALPPGSALAGLRRLSAEEFRAIPPDSELFQSLASGYDSDQAEIRRVLGEVVPAAAHSESATSKQSAVA